MNWLALPKANAQALLGYNVLGQEDDYIGGDVWGWW